MRAGGLSGRVNLLEQSEVRTVHALIHEIALKSDHIVDMLAGIGERPFPRAFGIAPANPRPVVFVIDDAAQTEFQAAP